LGLWAIALAKLAGWAAYITFLYPRKISIEGAKDVYIASPYGAPQG